MTLAAAALYFITLFFIVDAKLKWKNENEANGILLLDSVSFPKIVPSEKYSVFVGFFQKATIGKDDFSDQIRDEFLNFAVEGGRKGDMDGIICAQVIVNGAQNKRLAEMYMIKEFPILLLFRPNTSIPIPYNEAETNFALLSQFVETLTDYYVTAPGNIESLDKLAQKFSKAVGSNEREEIIKQAESLINDMDISLHDDAEYYVKIMKKIMSVGGIYVDNETKRVLSIIDSNKVSATKKEELKRKVNILVHFYMFKQKESQKTNNQNFQKENAASEKLVESTDL